MNIHISKENYKFLKELQNEMLTQDHCGQASPRFWAIKDVKKIYGLNSDYCEGCCICSEEGEVWSDDGEQSLEEWFTEFLEEVERGTDGIDINMNEEEEVIEWLNNEEYDNFELIYYRYEEFIVPSTMFLTLKDAKQHLELNYYHYTNKACAYALTAWRSPSVAKLYEVIENLKFEKEE